MGSRTTLNGLVLALAMAATMLGCGGSDSPPRKPDTGAGAGLTPPATENCADLCQRLGSCVVTLCNEDTMSTRFDGFDTLLAEQCTASCTDAQVQSGISASSWQCLFVSSCRQVFDYDTCHAMSKYNCS